MKNIASYWLISIASAAVLCVVACGDSETTSGSGTGTNTGTATGTATGTGGEGGEGGAGGGMAGMGGAGAGGGNPGQLYNMTVFDSGDNMPLAGANVAIDTDGGRFEGVTGTDGRVEIGVPDGVSVTASIAHKDGYTFQALVAELFQGTDINFGIFDITVDPMPPNTVEVSGALMNQVGGMNSYAAIAASTGSTDVFSGNSYSLRVADNTAFTLLAFDSAGLTLMGQDFSRNFNSVELINSPALTADMTIDISFGGNIAPDNNETVSIPMPADTLLATTGFAFYNVNDGQGAFMGGAFDCIENGATFDCAGGSWNTSATPQTVYIVADPATFSGDNSTAPLAGTTLIGVTDGLPQAAPMLDWSNPPAISAPAGNGPHAIDTPFSFSVPAGGGNYDLVFFQYWTDEFAFLGSSPLLPTAADFTLPALPTGSDSAGHFADIAGVSITTCRFVNNVCAVFSRRMVLASPPAN